MAVPSCGKGFLRFFQLLKSNIERESLLALARTQVLDVLKDQELPLLLLGKHLSEVIDEITVSLPDGFMQERVVPLLIDH